MNTGIFAPKETLLFHTILHQRCTQLRNGKPPLVVDVGTNVGWFTMLAASMGCRVISFEPNPNIHPYLQMSLALNGFEDRVQLHNSLVGDKETVNMFIMTKNWGYSHRDNNETDRGEETRMEIPMVSLDHIIKEGGH
jgi:FkbM family methyltransferase